MTTRVGTLPASAALGRAVGWLIWHTDDGKAWRTISSSTHALSDVPTDGFLAIRVFYETSTRQDPTMRYSDVCHGWNHYAAMVIGGTVIVWRSNDRDELLTTVPTGAVVFDGRSLPEAAWNEVADDLLRDEHARGWDGYQL